MKRARYILTLRPHLGPERVVWDLQNGEQLDDQHLDGQTAQAQDS